MSIHLKQLTHQLANPYTVPPQGRDIVPVSRTHLLELIHSYEVLDEIARAENYIKNADKMAPNHLLIEAVKIIYTVHGEEQGAVMLMGMIAVALEDRHKEKERKRKLGIDFLGELL